VAGGTKETKSPLCLRGIKEKGGDKKERTLLGRRKAVDSDKVKTDLFVNNKKTKKKKIKKKKKPKKHPKEPQTGVIREVDQR